MINKHNKKGFTLVEVIIAVFILATLSSILVPSLINIPLQSKVKKDAIKFDSMCVAFKTVLSDIEVQKEVEAISEGARFKIVYPIDEDGLIDFLHGEILTADTDDTDPIDGTVLWLNIYQTIGMSYQTESSDYRGMYLVFTLTPKTHKTTAQCTYEIVEELP